MGTSIYSNHHKSQGSSLFGRYMAWHTKTHWPIGDLTWSMAWYLYWWRLDDKYLAFWRQFHALEILILFAFSITEGQLDLHASYLYDESKERPIWRLQANVDVDAWCPSRLVEGLQSTPPCLGKTQVQRWYVLRILSCLPVFKKPGTKVVCIAATAAEDGNNPFSSLSLIRSPPCDEARILE